MNLTSGDSWDMFGGRIQCNAWAESEGSNKEVGHLFTPIFSVQRIRRYFSVGKVMQDPESSKEGETALKTRWTKF